MGAPVRQNEIHELDEGSWVYLSLWGIEQSSQHALHRRVVEACADSGWPAVSWSPPAHEGNVTDSARFFEGMNHAVEHADLVVVFVNSRSAMTDAELAFAYKHNRPVIALRFDRSEGALDSAVQAMLRRYGRARLIECASIDECATGLREAFADPEFAKTIREAARGQAENV